MNFVTFDIETYHPRDIDKIDTQEMRASVVGAYFSWFDAYIAFLEEDVKEFLNLLRQAELVVGFNQLWFDLPVLQKYADFDLLATPNYDIMVEVEKKVGYKMRLNELCKVNLGAEKTDTYSSFKNYYKDKNWEPLIDYCMHDVKLTNELFLQIRNTKKIKYQDLLEVKEVRLDEPQKGKVLNLGQQADSIF